MPVSGEKATCKVCNGSGKVYFRRPDGSQYDKVCGSCQGKGVSDKWFVKKCEICGGEILYPAYFSFEPKYCKKCRAENSWV